MGVISDILRGRRAGVLDAAPLPLTNVFSDGSTSHLARFVLPAEVLRALPASINRPEAESISAVSRGRNQLVTAIAPLPLVALKKDGTRAEQPTFLYRTDSTSTIYDRMAATIDSLIFEGKALWALKRGADGTILDAAWVPHDRWKLDDRGRVRVDGQTVDSREVILFTHIQRGLLNVATTTLRAAASISKAVARNAKNPVPLAAFEHADPNGVQLEDDEISDLLSQWTTARDSEDGAMGYVPPGLKLSTPSQPLAAGLLTEARNASRLDVADFLNMPVEMMGGSSAEGSLTYVTQEGSRNRFDAESVPFWSDPIAWRLSQDDVVPGGQRIRFDFSERQAVAQTPTGAPTDD